VEGTTFAVRKFEQRRVSVRLPVEMWRYIDHHVKCTGDTDDTVVAFLVKHDVYERQEIDRHRQEHAKATGIDALYG
jgi:hypothetical protein